VAWCLPVLDQPSNVSGATEPTRSWCATVPPTSQTTFTLLSKAATLEFERTTFLSASLLWTVLLCATLPILSWTIFCGAGRPLCFFQREISFRENPPLPTSEKDTRHYPPWLNEHTAGLHGFFHYSIFSHSVLHSTSTVVRPSAVLLLLDFCWLPMRRLGSKGFTLHSRGRPLMSRCFSCSRACLLATFLVFFCFEEPGGPDFERRVLRVEDFFGFLFVAPSLTPYVYPSIYLGRLMWTFQTRGLGGLLEFDLVFFSRSSIAWHDLSALTSEAALADSALPTLRFLCLRFQRQRRDRARSPLTGPVEPGVRFAGGEHFLFRNCLS